MTRKNPPANTSRKLDELLDKTTNNPSYTHGSPKEAAKIRREAIKGGKAPKPPKPSRGKGR